MGRKTRSEVNRNTTNFADEKGLERRKRRVEVLRRQSQKGVWEGGTRERGVEKHIRRQTRHYPLSFVEKYTRPLKITRTKTMTRPMFQLIPNPENVLET